MGGFTPPTTKLNSELSACHRIVLPEHPFHGTFNLMASTPPQIHNLSAIARDLGQVSAASIIVPAFLTDSDRRLVVLGLLFAVAAWAISHLLLSNLPNDFH
ncbi:MAG: hypothetical protein IH987_16520 [Planctomycetes bacterium]|nr:hypothetical protein [Planctomycetota bacterium]